MWIRANTATTNIADEMGRTLLGENEVDIYIEDDRSIILHLQHGVDQMSPVGQIGQKEVLSVLSFSAASWNGSSREKALPNRP